MSGEREKRGVRELNREYYSALYGGRSALGHRLRARISFDQQAKCRVNHRRARPLLERLVSSRRPVRVLDFGCGWGAFLLAMPRGPFELYCHDLAVDAVETVQRSMRAGGRKVQAVDPGEEGSLGEERFDLIVCSHVLEHVESDQHLVESFARALRPGGYCLVNVPINESWEDPRHVRSYDPAAIRAVVERAGLDVIETEETDRWSGFLLRHESAPGATALRRAMLRALRGLLAIAPWFAAWSEARFLGSQPNVQCVVVGAK